MADFLRLSAFVDCGSWRVSKFYSVLEAALSKICRSLLSFSIFARLLVSTGIFPKFSRSVADIKVSAVKVPQIIYLDHNPLHYRCCLNKSLAFVQMKL